MRYLVIILSCFILVACKKKATSGYWEGCHESATDVLNSPSDTILYEMEITKNGIKEIVYKKFYVGPEKLDTIKLYY